MSSLPASPAVALNRIRAAQPPSSSSSPLSKSSSPQSSWVSSESPQSLSCSLSSPAWPSSSSEQSCPDRPIVRAETSGAAFTTRTLASAAATRVPSVASTRAVEDQSSPHTCLVVPLGDQFVSQLPSPSKSQRYCKASPSGSEATTISSIGLPSRPETGLKDAI